MMAAMPTMPAATRASRILVVDDNRDAAVMLAELLVAYGYDARAAHDAASALDLGERFEPDLALLDIGLPLVDGYELARRFHAHPVLRRTRLIALTGHGQEQDRRQSAAAGFRGHLVKPVDVDKLRDLLDGLARTATGTAWD
jgi:CheY-like chemotaxis protein